jgi:hypothetical protein
MFCRNVQQYLGADLLLSASDRLSPMPRPACHPEIRKAEGFNQKSGTAACLMMAAPLHSLA